MTDDEAIGPVWVTKYALTDVVQKVPHVILCSIGTEMAKVGGVYFHGEGRDWHRTEEAAKNRAETMCVAKIESLKKKILKLDKLEF
jgi:hypothetical protein